MTLVNRVTKTNSPAFLTNSAKYSSQRKTEVPTLCLFWNDRGAYSRQGLSLNRRQPHVIENWPEFWAISRKLRWRPTIPTVRRRISYKPLPFGTN